MSENLVTYEVQQDGIAVGGVKREKGDLVTIPEAEGDPLERNDLLERTQKEVASPEAPEKERKTADEGRESQEKTVSSEGPLWSERIVIQRNTEKQDGRNIKINLWPPSESHPEYGPTLELIESRNVDGEWQDKRIRLTKGAKTLFLSELIREGWKKLREHS